MRKLRNKLKILSNFIPVYDATVIEKIKNKKVDVKSSTINKFAKNLSMYDKKLKINSEDLVIYKKEHITNFSRIDERKKN